jgi:hypothetical protein
VVEPTGYSHPGVPLEIKRYIHIILVLRGLSTQLYDLISYDVVRGIAVLLVWLDVVSRVVGPQLGLLALEPQVQRELLALDRAI